MSNRYSHPQGSYLLLKVKTKTRSKLVVAASQYSKRLFPDDLNYTPSPMRIILAKKVEKDELQHISGAFEDQYEKCCVSTKKEQEAGTYLIYVEMDQLAIEDKFSVLVMAHQIESMKEVKVKKYPNFIMN